jgi:hypothetical protein
MVLHLKSSTSLLKAAKPSFTAFEHIGKAKIKTESQYNM